MSEQSERPGFFPGMLFGLLLPLIVFGGGEIKGNVSPRESFYAGVIVGIFTLVGTIVFLVRTM